MKRLAFVIMTTALCAAILSCTKELRVNGDKHTEGLVEMTVNGSLMDTRLGFGAPTETAYPVRWSAEGESVRLYERVDASSWGPKTFSGSYTPSSDLKTASFKFNATPQTASRFENQVVNAASAAPLNIDLLPYFTDSDGETLSYSVKFSSTKVATGYVGGSILYINPEAYGQTTVTVTASDARGASCQAGFSLLARNAYLDLDVYPNPVTDYLYVRPSTQVQTRAALYSRSGAKVREEEENAGPFSPVRIDVRGLAPGTYTLRVDYGGKQHTSNIVKY